MSKNKKNISIIYYQKNDSPKFLEINKQKAIFFLVGLPTLTLIALTLGALGLIQTSPFHIIDNYRQNARARIAIATNLELQNKLIKSTSANQALLEKLKVLETNSNVASSQSTESTQTTPSAAKCPEQVACKQTMNSLPASSIGLSTLSFFKPIHGQKDKTNPASLNLTGFKVASSKDSVHLQFNIINSLGDDIKLSGHIIVLMKDDLSIQAYPSNALGTKDLQINYSAGEVFSTQRFRPVDASFVHPKKPGNYTFSVYIFSKTGDLIHYQNLTQAVR